MRAHPARRLADPRRASRRIPRWPPHLCDLRSSSSRWRAISWARYGCMYTVLTCHPKLRETNRSRRGLPRGARTQSPRPSLAIANAAAVRPTGIAGPGQGLDTDHIWVPGIDGKDLVPYVFARHPRLVDADVLHGRSAPRPVTVGNGLTGNMPTAGPVLPGRYERAPGVGVTQRCAGRWNLSQPARHQGAAVAGGWASGNHFQIPGDRRRPPACAQSASGAGFAGSRRSAPARD